MKNVTVYLDDDVKEKIELLAKKEDRSMANYLKQIIYKYLEDMEKDIKEEFIEKRKKEHYDMVEKNKIFGKEKN